MVDVGVGNQNLFEFQAQFGEAAVNSVDLVAGIAVNVLGHNHPALRRARVALPNGETAQIVAPAVIRVGETVELGAVPAIGQNSAAIRAEFGG